MINGLIQSGKRRRKMDDGKKKKDLTCWGSGNRSMAKSLAPHNCLWLAKLYVSRSQPFPMWLVSNVTSALIKNEVRFGTFLMIVYFPLLPEWRQAHNSSSGRLTVKHLRKEPGDQCLAHSWLNWVSLKWGEESYIATALRKLDRY